MSRLSRTDLLSPKPVVRIVPVPELGGEVAIEALSVMRRVAILDLMLVNMQEADAYDADQALPEADRANIAKVERLEEPFVMIIHSVIDEDGTPTFTMADYDLLRSYPYTAIERIYRATVDLNRFTPVDQHIDDAKKNLD